MNQKKQRIKEIKDNNENNILKLLNKSKVFQNLKRRWTCERQQIEYVDTHIYSHA